MGNDRLKPVSQLWQRPLLVRFAPYIIGGVILIILPPLLPSDIQIVMAKFLIFAIFSMSYNLVFGYTGLLSLGHAAYFGAGGYTVAMLMFRYNIDSFWIGAPLGILIAVFLAAVFGFIALRASGIYFLLVTFALGQLLYSLAWNLRWLNTSPFMQGI